MEPSRSEGSGNSFPWIYLIIRFRVALERKGHTGIGSGVFPGELLVAAVKLFLSLSVVSDSIEFSW